MEANDRVVEVGCQSGLHDLHQALRLGLPINDNVGAKEPVPAVLAVALCHVEELHIGGVPLQVILEQGRVVLEIPVIKCKPQLLQIMKHLLKSLQGTHG